MTPGHADGDVGLAVREVDVEVSIWQLRTRGAVPRTPLSLASRAGCLERRYVLRVPAFCKPIPSRVVRRDTPGPDFGLRLDRFRDERFFDRDSVTQLTDDSGDRVVVNDRRLLGVRESRETSVLPPAPARTPYVAAACRTRAFSVGL